MIPNMKDIILPLRSKIGSYLDKNELFVDLGLSKKKEAFKFKGFYKSWQDAARDSNGYQAEEIFNKVKEAALKVKEGKALFERDSILFYKKQYNWPLLAILLKISIENGDRLSIIDFGGSLGSMYFQQRHFLDCLKKIRWNVIEQKHYVEYGQKYFSSLELHFYNNLDDCIKRTTSRVLLASGVIQYIEDPYSLITQFINCNFDYIIFDRTCFIEAEDHKILIQEVTPIIYKVSYPLRVFNYIKFLSIFKDKYQLISDFDSYCDAERYFKSYRIYWKGLFLKKKRSV